MKSSLLPYLTLLLLFTNVSRVWAQVGNPTITTCEKGDTICAYSDTLTLCFLISIPADTLKINRIEIEWGDGDTHTINQVSDTLPPLYHTYYLGKDSCNFARQYVIWITTTYASGLTSNNGLRLFILRPPTRPAIEGGTVVCVNRELSLREKDCRGNTPYLGISRRFWLISADTIRQKTANYTFSTPGWKQIVYCVSNDCGTACDTQSVFVMAPATAELEADSGILVGYADPYRVCLDSAGAVIRLNALASQQVTQAYSWSVLPPTGWEWVDVDTPVNGFVRIRLLQEGLYTITVRVDNVCLMQSTKSITLQAIRAPVLTLNPQADACADLAYTPSPYTPTATYRINGVVQASFPVNLPISATPYVVEARMSNECGEQVQRDTFWIQPPLPIEIYTPADLTVCMGSDSIPLRASDTGTWLGGGSQIRVVNADTLFYPEVPGFYTLVIRKGAGACQRSDTTRIRVEGPYALQLNAPPVGCISTQYMPEPFDTNAQYYINGTWQTSFPIGLSAQGAPYVITAVAHNTCGEVRDSVVLNIVLPVEVSIEAPNDTVVCSGTAPLPLRASDTIGQWVGPHLEQTPQGDWVFNPVQAGTYTLIFERGSGLCRRADSVQVRVEPSDGVTAGPDRYACLTEGSLTLTGFGPGGGIFSGVALSGNTIDLTQLTLDSPYTYVYTVPTLPDVCNDDAMTLVVSGPPEVVFSASRDTTCVGYTVTLTPTATGSVQYEVNWGDGSVGAGLSHAYQAPGAYSIQLRAYTLNPLTGDVLCSATAMESVYVLRPITADSVQFWVKPDTGCAPLTVGFENQSFAENASYEWDFGNGQTHQGYQPGAVVFQQGIEDTVYYVRLTVRNACDSFARVAPITVRPQPRAAMGLTYEQPCSGGALEVSVLSRGNPAENTLFTSKGQVVSASRDKPSDFRFFTDSLPDTVRIWLVSANECGVDTAYQDVVVNPTNVYALIGLPDTTRLCVGDTARLLNLSTVGAPVRWATSDGNTFLGDTVWVPLAEAGLYQVALYTYGCGYDSIVRAMWVHPLPELAVTHPPARCPGDTIAFSAQTDAPGFWLAFGDGDTTTSKRVQKVYATPGVFPITATAISERGCRTTRLSTLTVLAPPVATAAGDDSLCVGAAAVFSGNSNIAGSRCVWHFGDGNMADACNPTHAYAAPGLFTAALTVISPEGCRDTDTVLVYVRTRPKAEFSYTVLQPCSPAAVAFQSQSTGATGLHWQLGDGTTQTTNAFQHLFAQGGTYEVQLIASNEGICYDTAFQKVVVFQTPAPAFELDPQCTLAEGTHLTVLTSKANRVQVSGPNYQQSGDFHPALPSGHYAISILTPENCRSDTLIFLLPPDELMLWLEEDSFDIRLGERVQLQARVNQTGVTFLWTPSQHLDRPEAPNPVAAPWQQASYFVVATNAAGCTKTDTVWIQVRIDRSEGLFIPTAFSPNGDGINDVFYVRSSNPAIEGFNRFQIFDKYDEKVFDALALPGGAEAAPENPLWGWDGTFRGSKAEMGSYRYVIELRYVDGVVRALSGTVQLLR